MILFETEEYEKIIDKFIRQGNLIDAYNLSKSLYSYEFVSEKIRMTYGQCLVLAEENDLALDVFEKLNDAGYVNYFVLSNLLNLSFEHHNHESSLFYLNELKRFCNRKQLLQLVPFEIYLYYVLGYDLNDICRTKSAFYLRNQITSFDQERAIRFIDYQNRYYDGFDNNTNFESLFFSSLNFVVNNSRGLQFNPFIKSICFFDKYYMNIDGFYFGDCNYKVAEISTLPFSNHICMVKPCGGDKSVKKLII